MIYSIVSVRDGASGAFGRPFFVHARGQAIRSFTDEINRSAADNEMNRHPEDFDLFFIGTFDDSNGGMTNAPELLLRGKDALNASH
ncbi:MAG: nonstructural protein [Microvirus sp.]|nr:MAG: nonstructural protein [Microvirus sp.]